MRARRRILMAILISVSLSSPVSAGHKKVPIPEFNALNVGKPVYFPEKKAYYELVKVVPGNSIRGPNIPAVTWPNANRLARQRIYKGIRGRLAIVDGPELSNFLRQQFAPRQGSWIGLRYLCQLSSLRWVDGSSHPRNGFKNWDTPWREGSVCSSKAGFAPIYVTGTPSGFVWRAQGSSKEMRGYFVEYNEVGEDGN